MSENADSSPLAADQEGLLHAALTTGFSVTDIPLVLPETPRAQPSVSTDPPVTTEPQPVSVAAEATLRDAHDEWKDEYERNLARWKQENTLQREKAERIRKEWEDRRAQGEGPVETDEFLGAHLAKVQNLIEGGWENLDEVKSGQDKQGSSSAADVRHIPSAKSQSGSDTNFLQTTISRTDKSPSTSTSTIQGSSEHTEEHHPARLHNHNRTPSNSSTSKWDSIPSSLTSSYPSLSFPESSKSCNEPRHSHDPHDRHPSRESHQHPNPPASLSVFDSSLSTKTRVIALLGSLTINLVLPFVNGVMLGFGEIFSENVLFRWFGWKKTLGRSSISDVGLRKR